MKNIVIIYLQKENYTAAYFQVFKKKLTEDPLKVLTGVVINA